MSKTTDYDGGKAVMVPNWPTSAGISGEPVAFDRIRDEVAVERIETLTGWGEYTALYRTGDATYYAVAE